MNEDKLFLLLVIYSASVAEEQTLYTYKRHTVKNKMSNKIDSNNTYSGMI